MWRFDPIYIYHRWRRPCSIPNQSVGAPVADGSAVPVHNHIAAVETSNATATTAGPRPYRRTRRRSSGRRADSGVGRRTDVLDAQCHVRGDLGGLSARRRADFNAAGGGYSTALVVDTLGLEPIQAGGDPPLGVHRGHALVRPIGFPRNLRTSSFQPSGRADCCPSAGTTVGLDGHIAYRCSSPRRTLRSLPSRAFDTGDRRESGDARLQGIHTRHAASTCTPNRLTSPRCRPLRPCTPPVNTAFGTPTCAPTTHQSVRGCGSRHRTRKRHTRIGVLHLRTRSRLHLPRCGRGDVRGHSAVRAFGGRFARFLRKRTPSYRIG